MAKLTATKLREYVTSCRRLASHSKDDEDNEWGQLADALEELLVKRLLWEAVSSREKAAMLQDGTITEEQCYS